MNTASFRSRAAVAALILGALSVTGFSNQDKPRAYVAGRFALTMDGSKSVSFLKSLEGGSVRAEEIRMEMGIGMAQPMIDWINAFLRTGARRNGSIAYAGVDNKVRAYRDFRDALITEVRVPPLDKSSKDAAYLTIKIRPESMQTRPGNNTPILSTNPSTTAQKRWLPANFKFEIDGLDCRSITQLRLPNLVTKTPTPGGPVPIPYPNVSAQAANWEFRNGWPVKWEGPDFAAWQRNFRPRPGRLVLLDESGAPLLQINFRLNRLIKGIPNQNGRSMNFELMFDSFMLK